MFDISKIYYVYVERDPDDRDESNQSDLAEHFHNLDLENVKNSNENQEVFSIEASSSSSLGSGALSKNFNMSEEI